MNVDAFSPAPAVPNDAPDIVGPVATHAPRPQTVEETGLSSLYLADLVVKHLYESGVLDLGELASRVALSGALLEKVLAFLREEARVEVKGQSSTNGLLRFGLTERGRASALEALARDGYTGPAPVPLADYESMVQRQSGSTETVSRDDVHAAFSDTVIRPEVLDQLGPALHSGRAMFIYGAPGTGKSFIARRLARLLSGAVLIPHAIMVAEKAVRCFDPGLHVPTGSRDAANPLQLDRGHDPRYVLCERPIVITGGELTLEMLDLRYDEATRVHQAPPQVKANNGLLVIDDLGRQRVQPIELFNRWIVPLEDRCDYLALRNGQHFRVPFDLALVFSTNQNPRDLADEAFLRRIGYKIRFENLDERQYSDIWHKECMEQGIEYDAELVRYVIDELHQEHQVPLLPCHPRDLINLAMDRGRYVAAPKLTPDAMRWAWNNYFVRLD